MKTNYFLLQLMMIVTSLFGIFPKFAVAYNESGKTGVSPITQREPDLLSISINPASAPPGTLVTVTRTAGQRTFGAGWKVSFTFAEPNRPDADTTFNATPISSTQLRFAVPSNVGCGTYRVFVFSGSTPAQASARSNSVLFSVTAPCLPIPRIAGFQPGRGVAGWLMTVTGQDFRSGISVKLVKTNPPPARLIELPAIEVTATQFRFELPPVETAGTYCGSTKISVKDPAVRTGSNWVDLAFPCPRNSINVVAYNVAMLPSAEVGTPFGEICVFFAELCTNQAERAPRIPKRTDLAGQDVIILGEAFSPDYRRIIVMGFQPQYPYHSRVPYHTPPVNNGKALDGGVVILSKWPIVNGDGLGEQRLFGSACNGTTGSGNDCMADKGVIYVKINKEGQFYHIFGTHLDSGWDRADREARRKQLEIIKQFIVDKQIPLAEAVIVGGDMNIDPFKLPGEYGDMLSILDVIPGRHEGVTTPEGRYVTHTGGDHLDYVLYSDVHLKPRLAINQILENQGLSDHYPVIGRFIFPEFQVEQIGPLPFR